MPKPQLSRLKALAVSLASIVVLVTMTACQATVAPRPKPELTVMTYNVYVGASPTELLMANQTEIPTRVAEFYRNYQASDFRARAAAIAKIIKKSKPHVVGLQEISVIRTQTPADSLTNPEAQPNAETVEIDFLKVVEAALKAEGLDYKVAGKVETFDLEMPGLTPTGLVDIRLTDHDAILVRGDVSVSETAQAAKYPTYLSVGNLDLNVPRGYVAVNVKVGGVTYLVVNTHLEHFSPQVRLAQTRELLARLNNESPVILLGDFNTKATEGDAYQAITAAGFTDVWQSKDAGDTCCQADNLMNATSQLGDPPDGGRIDLIFTKGVTTRESASVSTYTVGDKPEDRTPAGLWPSDHAGVVAHLPLPEQKE